MDDQERNTLPVIIENLIMMNYDQTIPHDQKVRIAITYLGEIIDWFAYRADPVEAELARRAFRWAEKIIDDLNVIGID